MEILSGAWLGGSVNRNGGYLHLYNNAIEFRRRYIPVPPLRQPRFGTGLLHVPNRHPLAETIRGRRFSNSPLSTTKAELNRWDEDRVRRISNSFPIVNVFKEPTIFSLQIRPDLPRWMGIRSMMSP